MMSSLLTLTQLLCLSIVVQGGNGVNVSTRRLEERIEALERQGTWLLKRLDKQEEQLQSQSLVIKKQEKLLLQQDHETEELKVLVRTLNHTVQHQGQAITKLKTSNKQEEQLQSQSLVIKKQEKLLLQQADETEEFKTLVRTLNHTVQDQGLTITRLQTSNRLLSQHTTSLNYHNSSISIHSEGTVNDTKSIATVLTNKVKHLRNELPGIRQTELHQTKRLVVGNESPVAFHAVIDRGEVPHLGVNQNIVFETVLENFGGGYHNQHGVFIAPRDGIYIFSVSIMSYVNPHPEADAELKKDGVVLARVFTHGDNGREDQGSVTIVTKLNQGNEVWVSLGYPSGTSIYGGRDSSFMGCLIYAV